MNTTDWQERHVAYRGPVRYVLDDLSIGHGVAVDAQHGHVLVCVDGAPQWHPWERVWPSHERFEGAA